MMQVVWNEFDIMVQNWDDDVNNNNLKNEIDTSLHIINNSSIITFQVIELILVIATFIQYTGFGNDDTHTQCYENNYTDNYCEIYDRNDADISPSLPSLPPELPPHAFIMPCFHSSIPNNGKMLL